jgi:carbon monoxide dehydrogenase subunit G
MELTNEFRVGVSVPEAWKVLTDVERIAPLMPGARLTEVEGDEYRGSVKVKVGPITAEYKGKATFEERDEAAGRVVLRASGRDSRGQGNANALITATMTPDGDGTKVSVVTDLTVSGKVAQFGRGVLGEVSAKLLGQFVDALEADLEKAGPSEANATEPGGEGADASETVIGNGAASSGEVRRIEGPEAEPVDLFSVAGGSTMKRLVPVAVVALVVLFVLTRWRVRQRSNR